MFKLSDYFVKREEAGGEDKPAPGKTYSEEEVAELVAGLKANNDRLLTEKKEAKRREDEAAAARLQSDQEAARKSGEIETFEKTIRGQYETQIEGMNKTLTARNDRILSSERRSVINAVLTKGKFIDAEAAEILQHYVKTEFDGEDVVTKFVGAGGVITTDIDKFVEYCGNHKILSHLMAATGPSGGGASGGKDRPGAKSFNELTDAERIELHKKDPAEFKRLSTSQRK